MRIVFFQSVSFYAGGSVRCMIDLARRLKEHVAVSVVNPYGEAESYAAAVREAGVDYHSILPVAARAVGGHGNILRRIGRVLMSVPHILKMRRRAKALLCELKPDVICSNDFKNAWIVGSTRALRHIPLVIHMHGWYMRHQVPSYGRRLARRRCAALIAVSHQTRTALRCSGIEAEKIHVLHNPIDVPDMLARASKASDAAIPQRDRAVRILLASNIYALKGHHVAVRALKELLRAGHDAVLWCAGRVIDRTYAQELNTLINDLGVADRVELLGERGDVPQLMDAATVVALPSRSEGLPLVVLEAMALAKPIVATPVGGVLEMVVPNMTGLLCRVEDHVELAARIDYLARSPEEAARMGRQAQEYMRLSFTPAQHTAGALGVFKQIVDDHARTG